MREGRCGRVSSTDSIHRFQSLLMFFPVNSPPFGDFSCITDLVLPSTFVTCKPFATLSWIWPGRGFVRERGRVLVTAWSEVLLWIWKSHLCQTMFSCIVQSYCNLNTKNLPVNLFNYCSLLFFFSNGPIFFQLKYLVSRFWDLSQYCWLFSFFSSFGNKNSLLLVLMIYLVALFPDLFILAGSFCIN